ncbi:MAG: hypothetical protein ACRELV_03710, partial [Longimicrobiales bacterium]
MADSRGRARASIVPLGATALGVALLIAAGVLLFQGREAGAGADDRIVLPPPPPPPPATAVAYEDFVGAETCGECHPDQFAEWRASTHGRAGGAPSPEIIIAPFDGTPIRFRDAVVTPERTESGDYVFRVAWQGAPEQVLHVDGVVGGGHMVGGGTQGFLSRQPDGTVRFLPFDFSRQEGVWFCNTGTRLDEGWVPITSAMALADCGDWPPTRVLGVEPRFGNCQQCHGSQIQLRLDPAAAKYETRVRSLEINCESCHGPGREHVRLIRAGAAAGVRAGDVADASGTEAPVTDLAIRTMTALSKNESLELCFSCHALKDPLRPGYISGEPLEAHFSLKLPLLGDEALYPDGRIRTFAYQANHLYSDCYLNGSMTCVDCHDPHSQEYRDVNGRPLASRFSNGQCLGCHPSKAEPFERHT